MKAPAYRPRRRLVSELFPLCSAVLLTAAVVSAFPREAVGFKPKSAVDGSVARCAYVSLSPAVEAKVLAAARSAWQVDGGVRRTRLELLSAKLPETPSEPLADVTRRTPPRLPPAAVYRPSLLPQSLAAPPPAPLAAGTEDAAPPAFPREELLRLN